MANNYLPSRDNDFLNWATNFSTYVTAHSAELPIDSQQAAALGTEVSGFRTNLNGLTTARDAAHAACETKDEKRESAEMVIRNLARQFQASPDVTDAQRQAMGLPVHSSERAMAAAAQLNAPIASVDTSKRLTHTVRYWDSQGAGKARPEGVVGVEVWSKITAPGEVTPSNPSQFAFLAINSASPFVNELGNTDGGKTVHYLMRWVARDNAKGPWSEIISATVAGF